MLIFDQLNKSDPHLRAMTLAVLAGMSVLLAGLWFVQVASAERYKSNLKNQSFRTVRIPAPRGKILDRDGVALAESRPSYNVSLYLHELRGQFAHEYTNYVRKEYLRTNRVASVPARVRPALQREARYRVASNLVARLGTQLDLPLTLDRARFDHHYTNQLALPLALVSKLDYARIARFHENSVELPGVDLDMQPVRVYPVASAEPASRASRRVAAFGPLAAQTVGHLRRDDSSTADEEVFFNFRLPDYKGAFGIEALFDQELSGKAGMKTVVVNSGGYRQSESEWVPAQPGKNVVLTIAAPIQLAAEKALASGPDRANTRGAIVVMDVTSGDVLALASSPSFDPNQFVPRLPAEQMARLNDPELRPMFNRATFGAYAPGSIFKVITGLAALEAAGIDPLAIYHSPGYYYVGTKPVRDPASHGQAEDFDFKKGFKRSSNAYFVEYCGRKTGEEPMLDLCRHLHLGERTGILPGQEVAGALPTKAWLRKHRLMWYAGDTDNLSIGQGYLTVTPMQMAAMVSAVANGGKVFWPRLVDRIEPQTLGGERVKFPAARLRDQLPVSQKNLEIVRAAMLADVEEAGGTGQGARVAGLRVCGKTGTAQVKDEHNELKDEITWFASFAPYESPRYAVVVMVESGTSGGTTCAPLSRQVYAALQTWEKSSPRKTEAVAAR